LDIDDITAELGRVFEAATRITLFTRHAATRHSQMAERAR
jgi:hypothetical protein